MAIAKVFCSTLLALACTAGINAQDRDQEVPIPQLLPSSARKPALDLANPAPPPTPEMVSLTVPKGTSLQVALERELRVKKVGQRVHARVVEPVYAFDHLVVPAGAEIDGEVTKIERTSGGKRTLAALDGDFTPTRKIEIAFHELVLADGKHLPLHTRVTEGSGQVIQLVTAPDKEGKKSVKDVASEKTKEAKQQARQQWDSAMKQLKTPGRVRRLERYAEAQLPVHAQYIPAGTAYFAELDDSLDFGSELMTPQMASSMGSSVPEGCVVHARLITPLSSATAQKGQSVEAVLSRPLFDGDRLIFPQGSRLIGTVGQVQPARHLKKNGQLRIAFHELVPPDGIDQKIQATLVGVQAGKDGNVKLDSEGGAEATTSKSRYASVALALGLATVAAKDSDGDGGGSAGSAGSAHGFKLVGLAAAMLARSRAFGYTAGAYGAGTSIYRNFMARGHEVVFLKNTAMEIGIGTRAAASPPPATPPESSSNRGLVNNE